VTKKRKIIYASTGIALIILIWIGRSVISYLKGFSSVTAWFNGSPDSKLTEIRLEIYGSEIVIRDPKLLAEIDAGIKRKSPSLPGGGRSCSAQAQIDGKWWGEINVSCYPDSKTITIGIPSQLSLRPDFDYAELEVSLEHNRILYQVIDGTYNLME